MDLKMLCLGRRLGETRALTEVFATRTDAEVLDKAVQASMGLIPLGQCADEQALLADVPPPEDPATRTKVEDIRKQLAEAEALKKTSKYVDGLRLAQEALTASEKIDYKPVLAEATYRIGNLLDDIGKYQDAERELRHAAKIADAAGYDKLRARALNDLIYVVGYRLARYRAAEKIIETAGLVIDRIKDEGEIRAKWFSVTGLVADGERDFDRELECHERALKIQEKIFGPEHLAVAASHNGIGIVFDRKGELDRALEHYTRALNILEKVLGPEHRLVANTLSNIGTVNKAKGDNDLALKQYERSLEIQEKVLGPEHPDVALAHFNIGLVLNAKDEHDRALEQFERALTISEKTLGPDHPDVAMMHTSIGNVFDDQGDYSRALEHHEKALGILEKALGPAHPDLSWPLRSIGKIALKRKDYPKAKEMFERLLSICGADKCEGEARDPLAVSRFSLAEILWRTAGGKDRERARGLARQALEYFKSQEAASDREMVKEIEAWFRERGGSAK
jgi:eukaryotic-like serine/threonine-protein kinase